MAGRKQIKNKIKSVWSIKKMTKALEVVSTIKLQKIKKQTENYRDFIIEFLKISQVVNFKFKNFEFQNEILKKDRQLIIVVSTDKWLCGSINSKLFKHIISSYDNTKNTTDIFAIWKKSFDFFNKNGFNIIWNISVKDNFSDFDLLDLNKLLSKNIQKSEYGQISLFFNYFQNTITQKPIELKLLPLDENWIKKFIKDLDIDIDLYLNEKVESKDIILEPNPLDLQKAFLTQFIQYIIYGSILQNKAWEFASRMIAMKNAKDNASQVMDWLILQYNKIRQTAITREVSEIVGAKMALEW